MTDLFDTGPGVGGPVAGGIGQEGVWSDDFERTDLGPDWTTSPAGYVIDTGAAVSTVDGSTFPANERGMYYDTPAPLNEGAFVEAAFTGLTNTSQRAYLYLRAGMPGHSQHLVAEIYTGTVTISTSGGDVISSTSISTPVTGTVTLRFECEANWSLAVYINGELASTGDASAHRPFINGLHTGIGAVGFAGAASPRIESVAGGPIKHQASVMLKVHVDEVASSGYFDFFEVSSDLAGSKLHWVLRVNNADDILTPDNALVGDVPVDLSGGMPTNVFRIESSQSSFSAYIDDELVGTLNWTSTNRGTRIGLWMPWIKVDGKSPRILELCVKSTGGAGGGDGEGGGEGWWRG